VLKRGAGIILHFGGGGPQTLPGLGGFKVALDAIEGLRRREGGDHGQYRAAKLARPGGRRLRPK
jgi:3-oxoacyl-[acyl-carrier protein] reductase